jgi:hypothetical protein
MSWTMPIAFTRKDCKKPVATVKGIKFILDEMAEKQPRARNVAPESFVDLSLLQELDQNGFFKQDISLRS